MCSTLKVRLQARLAPIRKPLKKYERMKMLVDQCIDLATELSFFRIKPNGPEPA